MALQGFAPSVDLGPSALRLFGRGVQLDVTSQPTSGGYFDGAGSSTLTITDMRVEFTIKKSIGKTPNPAVVTVTNLSKANRLALGKLPLYCTLRAGHDGQLYPLFAGNVTYGRSDIKGTDWETKLQVADGARAFSHARLEKSYQPPISVSQIVADCAATMGLSVPPEIAAVAELRQALTGGLTAFAPTRDILSRVLSRFQFSWSIQDGRLQILPDGQPNAKTPWDVNVDAGMIGSPEGSIPHKPGAVSELTIKLLLFPQVQPGDTIRVTSRAYDQALFRVNDVEHRGDTHGKEWTTSLKAAPIGSPLHRGRGKRGR